jgi:hypothetical protein
LGTEIQIFQYLHLPPKYGFDANIIVVQPSREIISKFFSVSAVKLIFFTDNEQPITCDVVGEMSKKWKAKLK